MGQPPESPLPAGEGWVREKRGAPPSAISRTCPTVIPALHRHSRPFPVIPAKAGIHPPLSDKPGLTGVPGSGRRRNDGKEGRGMMPECGFPLSRE